ncbi:ModD protein [uncultured Rhodoblastus sp.]|uniref:ModD protein n=1 Tax=uncultured Rhodoblastus sp. TaxID=543037 RepID=UPI0025CCF219|nr:ModD protein [uncultured Rhodoblastus sp.]
MPIRISREKLERLLFDDAPHGDLTTDLLGLAARPGAIAFSARGDMVVALANEAATILEMAGARVEIFCEDGQRLAAGAPILRANGPAGALLRGWKVAQTLIEIWSGVATATRDIVDAARSVAPGVCVACTRKNTPGVKDFSVAAIRAGGAVMHRLGLSETILVFPEHLAFTAGVPLEEIAARLRSQAPEKKLVIEACGLDEAISAAEAGFEVIQAEKFTPEDIARLKQRLRGMAKPLAIAAAGGINSGNAADYARAGADILVTSAPYAAAPRDVGVRLVAEG